jgi:hypothetical protein
MRCIRHIWASWPPLSYTILEAWSLLKIVFAVTDATSIFKIHFAGTSGRFYVAVKLVDVNGSAGINLSRLWHRLAKTQPRSVDKRRNLAFRISDQCSFHRQTADAYLAA